VVDIATLTGACLIALGTRIAGVMGTSQKHIQQLIKAGTAVGEPVWQLPLDDGFQEMVKGDITDYKNYSGRNASSITAAALLAEFAGQTPWLHIDIAGTCWTEDGKISYQKSGGTGYGVDLLIRFLENLATRTRS
jgi:leucyl aminopeptidase